MFIGKFSVNILKSQRDVSGNYYFRLPQYSKHTLEIMKINLKKGSQSLLHWYSQLSKREQFLIITYTSVPFSILLYFNILLFNKTFITAVNLFSISAIPSALVIIYIAIKKADIFKRNFILNTCMIVVYVSIVFSFLLLAVNYFFRYNSKKNIAFFKVRETEIRKKHGQCEVLLSVISADGQLKTIHTNCNMIDELQYIEDALIETNSGLIGFPVLNSVRSITQESYSRLAQKGELIFAIVDKIESTKTGKCYYYSFTVNGQKYSNYAKTDYYYPGKPDMSVKAGEDMIVLYDPNDPLINTDYLYIYFGDYGMDTTLCKQKIDTLIAKKYGLGSFN